MRAFGAAGSRYDKEFLGPAVVSQAILSIAIRPASSPSPNGSNPSWAGGINNCGNAQNCVKVCPKKIPLTRSIAKAYRDTTIHAIKRWLSR
jgi:succinate dehydrogenase / fumarate reductase iron-sulfur subunit